MYSTFVVPSFDIFDDHWALLTAGSANHFNTMTISWGGLGTLWNKPVATVYVKPVRYTHSFMEESDYFTVSFYDNEYRTALMTFGTKSGRDTDKPALAEMTPMALEHGVTYKEAAVTLVCKKIYHQDMDPDAMPTEIVDKYYRDEEPHTMYIGEVVGIFTPDHSLE